MKSSVTRTRHVLLRRTHLVTVAIYAFATLFFLNANPLHAADFGGECCADLKERISDLEATTARKGNRKVSLTVSGHVNQAVLFWDDGFEENAYVVGNKNDQTNFGFGGSASVSSDLEAGYQITIRLEDTLSDSVDQFNDDAFGFHLWESYVYLESKTAGRLSWGQVSRVSDTAPENDLSETGSGPAYAGVQDLGGGFFLRRSDNALTDVTWGDLYSHLNGDTANVARYDTPTIAGFVLSASYGEDDVWDVGIRYDNNLGPFLVHATVAYTQVTDENGLIGIPGELDQSIVVVSIAISHEPSGLSALIAAGQRSFGEPVVDFDGRARTPNDYSYIYTKLGWISKDITTLGSTAFYGEYGRIEDFLTVGADPTTLEATPGTAARVTSSEAEVWGIGVVQHIKAAEMQLYLGYRHHEANFSLVNNTGASVATTGLEDFDTIVAGSLIAF